MNQIFDGKMKEIDKQADEIKKGFLDGSVNLKAYSRSFAEKKRDYYMLEMMKKKTQGKK